jgi:hypothetical protein
MKRRVPTDDIERLARAAEADYVEVSHLLHPPTGRLMPPLPDPGTGPGFTRRTQAKNDLAFWRRLANRERDRLGDAIANGTVIV